MRAENAQLGKLRHGLRISKNMFSWSLLASIPWKLSMGRLLMAGRGELGICCSLPGAMGTPRPRGQVIGRASGLLLLTQSREWLFFSLKANFKHIRSTRLINGLAWASPGHRDSAWHHHREKVLLRSGYAKWLKVGIEIKMRQRTTGWACQCTHVLSVGEGMAFYNQRFQGDPARDECPCPKKGMEKNP